MSISSELLTLNNTKTAIRTAINNKGGSVGASDTFASYATAITNLPSGGSGNPLIESIDVSDFTGTTFNEARQYITSATIPSGVTTINWNAFQRCSRLTNVTVPNTVINFGHACFSGCSSLANISIPESTTTIEYEAFNGCSSLTSVAIPNSVTSIGYSAFDGCTSLAQVTFGTGITGLPDRVFSGCSSLANIRIPNTVTSIGSYTFSGCTSLTNIELSDNVTSIGSNAFTQCRGLNYIKIGSGITSIAANAFSQCTGLSYFICKATVPPTLANTNAFTNTNNCPIYVPAESVAAYKAATNWSTYESRIFAIQQVATVDGNPVYNYDLGMTGTVVGVPQMAKMPTGTTIEFAEGITSIQQVISGYTTVTLPSTLTGLENLQNIIGSSVTTLIIKADTPPTAQANTPGGAGLTALYVPEASVTDYQADAAWGQFSAITYPLYEVAWVDGNAVYNADLGETGQVTTMTSAMLAALPTGTSVKFSDDIDTFSGQIGAYEQVTLPVSGMTPLEFTVASPINAATETLTVKFNAISGPDIVVANNTLGGAGLTEIIIESDICGIQYNIALEATKQIPCFVTFADIIKAKPEDFMVITNLDVDPAPNGVITMSLAHAEQDTESADPNAMIYYAPFTICKPSFATDQATSNGTYLNPRGQQRDYTPTVTGFKLYNGDTLVASEAFVEVDKTGIGQDWDSANNVWSIIFYTDQIGDGSATITLQPGMRFEGFIDGINYDYDSETSCTPHVHSYFTINVTA